MGPRRRHWACLFFCHVGAPARKRCFTNGFQGFSSSVRFPRWPPASQPISRGAPGRFLCFPKVFEGSRPFPWRPGACLFFCHVGAPAPKRSFTNGFPRFLIFRKFYFFFCQAHFRKNHVFPRFLKGRRGLFFFLPFVAPALFSLTSRHVI